MKFFYTVHEHARILLATLAAFTFLNSASGANFFVTMRNFSFSPASSTISVGDTVTWTNAAGTHDTISGSAGVPSGFWNSNSQFPGLMQAGQTFSVTFNMAGTFPYYCTPHWRGGMFGSIRVIAPNSPPTVSILSPANGSDFSVPADITVQANASDPDGSVTRVEFFMNGSSIAVVPAQPYSVTVTNLGAGSYTFMAVATDNAGATGSASVSVSVSGQPPVITVPPQPQTVNAGRDVVFSVQAMGSLPLAYQWSFGGTNLEGATGSSLLLTNVSSTNEGTYSVLVSNLFGSASASAFLMVTNPPMGTPPSILVQPQSQTVTAGTNVTFNVEPTGSEPLSLQWFFGNAPIADATNLFLSLTNVTPANEGAYSVAVSNAFGSTNSSTAFLTVIVPPVCEFALSKPAASFSAAEGADSVNVLTGPECSWTVIKSSADVWINITSSTNGLGPGTVTFTVLSNATRTARSAVLVIAGQSFAIMQAGTLFPAKNDFNHDGNTDFLWQRTDGRIRLWLMEGVTRIGTIFLRNGRPVPPGWQIVDTYDFNQDRNVDLLLQHSSGRLAIWFMNGTNFLRSELISGAPALGKAWRVVGMGDFNQNNHEDILFRHADGYLLLWFMKGKNFRRQLLLYDGEPIPPAWRVVGVSELNNEAQPDILWQNPNSSLVAWFMVQTAPINGPLLSHLPRRNARIVGLNDLNQDGSTDFIWRHANGQMFTWPMNGTNRLGTNDILINGGEIVGPAWNFVAPKD